MTACTSSQPSGAIAKPKRWGWLAVSPLLDVYLTGIMIVGVPATGVAMLYELVFD